MAPSPCQGEEMEKKKKNLTDLPDQIQEKFKLWNVLLQVDENHPGKLHVGAQSFGFPFFPFFSQ